MSDASPIVNRIRIIPRPDEFLDRNFGSSGEVFFNKDTNSLRVYSGRLQGGYELAKSDLTNIDNSILVNKLIESGFETGGGASLTASPLPPEEPEEGSLWLDTTNGIFYVYYVDQDSAQWVQPYSDYISGQTNNFSTVVISSNVPPTNPVNGALWFNTLNGNLYVYYQDSDSAQWIQPQNAGPSNLLDLDISDGNNGQVLTTDGNGNFTFETFTVVETDTLDSVTTRGNITANGITVGSLNDHTIPPSETPDTLALISDLPTSTSDLTNNSGFINLTSLTQNPNALASGSGNFNYNSAAGTFTYTPPDLTGFLTSSDLSTYATNDAISSFITASDTISFSNLITFQETAETTSSISGANAIVQHNFQTANIFYHTNLGGDFTANFVNVPTDNDRALSVVLVLVQGSTAYIPSGLSVDGTGVTINWQGGSIPSGNANLIDVVSFTLLRQNSTWTALGSLTTYN